MLERPIMERDAVYFTWPDRTFSYACRGCAACCKGLGIGLDQTAGEVRSLSSRYPNSLVFLRKRGMAWTAFNPRGRCWFLDDEGLCRIETDHGRQAKPASCRLFPFNRVFRLGRYMVVDYNSVICPLDATWPSVDIAGQLDGRAGSSGLVSHDDVLAEIATIADDAVVGTPIAAEHAEDGGRRLVARERAIARACFSAAASETPGLDAAWRAQGADPSTRRGERRKQQATTAVATLDRATARLSEGLRVLTGQGWRAPVGDTRRNALWLTPSLRFNELFGPRDYDPLAEREKLLPHLWLVWLHAIAVGAELAGRDLTLQAATSVWSEIMPLANVVARWFHAPIMEPGPIELPGEADPDRVIERFAQACLDNRKPRRPLSDLLIPLLDARDRADRVVLARMLEPLLRLLRWRRPRN